MSCMLCSEPAIVIYRIAGKKFPARLISPPDSKPHYSTPFIVDGSEIPACAGHAGIGEKIAAFRANAFSLDFTVVHLQEAPADALAALV